MAAIEISGIQHFITDDIVELPTDVPAGSLAWVVTHPNDGNGEDLAAHRYVFDGASWARIIITIAVDEPENGGGAE